MRDIFRKKRTGRTEANVLSQRQSQLLEAELAALERLGAVLEAYPATQDDLDALETAAEQLSALFLLVVVGEFNSGKSAFLNALIGERVMPEGVTPTTAVINLLQYGESQGERMLPDGIIARTYPAGFLEDITLVDTPGTNAIVREHEALTQRFVPKADLVLFITSADRPFTESERQFMATIREWGKKITVIINKIDLIRTAEEQAQVVSFVTENIERLLGFRPDVFPISTLMAQQAKSVGESNPAERNRLWTESNFGALEKFILETLDEESRIRLKLLSPLGIGEHLTQRYQTATNERLAVLADDVETLQTIDRQLQLYAEDMRRQFAYHLTRIENIINKMNARGDEFFEDTVRIGRVFDLLNSDKIKAEFERKVVGDTETQIDATIHELIDWMVEQDLRTWESVQEYVDRRRLAQYQDEIIGEVGAQFRYDRKSLLDSVSNRAKDEVDRYDPEAAAHELSVGVRNAVAQVAVAEVGAVGLGALVVAAASTVALDITGIMAASLIAGLGLFILPRKRRQSRLEFRRRSDELEKRLIEVMTDQFEHELSRSINRIEDAISPYTRFVRDQQAKFTGIDQHLGEIADELRSLRHQVGDPEAGLGREAVSAGLKS
jgi:small GTP-binding protein